MRRLSRTAVLATVFVVAACGLVYELALVALGSYLIGDTVGQASIVLGVMVFAMGVGAFAVKPLQKHAAGAFAAVEIVLALLGGLSVLTLYAAFAWLDLYVPALIAVAFVLGLLIGAEIPLLMVLLQKIRKQDAGEAVSDLFAADYVGALLGGLVFPFLLLPVFGLIQGALVVGALNALCGLALVLGLFRTELGRRSRWVLTASATAVFALLGFVYTVSDNFETTAQQQLYRDPIVHSQRTKYQDIVITKSVSLSGAADVRLFLNGDLQFSSVDEYRYHEALVHPAMSGPHGRVLVLGGGDGLALREVLKYPGVRAATLVELDPAVIALAKAEPLIRDLNGQSFNDPRVTVVNTDAFTWLRDAPRGFDVVIADLPDPDSTATAKLYSTEFYGLIKQVLAPGGRLVVQSGSPYFAPKSFWCIDATVRAAGLVTTQYHAEVPSFGDWGFVLAGAGEAPGLRLAADAPPRRYLDAETLSAASVFPADRRRLPMEPSTLTHPRIIDLVRAEWKNY
ncbi:polyamine aminopropyltransferase [Longispora albida]|uniref:polyamine aminopropyltransferase n=1 Tax=Longispora albida TaxID=203523 RepID=UPI00035F3633|nr:polyamine aminopropyltransferase [Longispora albida]